MTFLLRILCLVTAAQLPVFAGATPAEKTEAAPAAVVDTRSFVRVIATNQNYDFLRPWIKRPPYTRRGLGTVLTDGRILITAELVLRNAYVELEKIDSGEKCPAEVAVIDYQANLALLRPSRPDFLKGARPLELDAGARVGDRAEVVQLEPNGSLATTGATITTVTVANYPIDELGLLIFRLSVPLQQRDGSFVLPAVRNGRLLGLLMRYDARSQTAELIPPPVIRHFLKGASATPYAGFSRAGISFAKLRDPQLRRYLGLKENGGVFVDGVAPQSPAAKAGLQSGDVILSVNGNPVDADGNYENAEYGRIPFSHLLTTESFVGDSVPFSIWRSGQIQTINVKSEPRDPAGMKVPSLQFDKPPRYLIAGGLVFQELTRPYLLEWGPDWRNAAPQRLVYYDAFQDELPADRKKIVFLSRVLPSPGVLGYEGLEHLVVKSANGQPIQNLEDLAAALKQPENGFHRIEVEEDPGVIYLDPQATDAEAESLQRQYGLPALQNF